MLSVHVNLSLMQTQPLVYESQWKLANYPSSEELTTRIKIVINLWEMHKKTQQHNTIRMLSLVLWDSLLLECQLKTWNLYHIMEDIISCLSANQTW